MLPSCYDDEEEEEPGFTDEEVTEPPWEPEPPPAPLTWIDLQEYLARSTAEEGRLTREYDTGEKERHRQFLAGESEKSRELERWWRTQYAGYLDRQLAQTAFDNEEDRKIKREAIAQQAKENEQKLQLLRRQGAQEHQARSAASTGYWVGPLGTGGR